MITKVYAHILDEDRKVNAQKFEAAFYSNPDLRKVKTPEEKNPELNLVELIEQLKQSPELATILAEIIRKTNPGQDLLIQWTRTASPSGAISKISISIRWC